jgi:hypothetical protein
MAHAGTIDLGRQAKPSSSQNPWLVGFIVVSIAAVAVGYLATASGLTSGNLPSRAATVDRSYDQIEAQRGVVALPIDNSYDQIEQLRGKVVAPPAVVPLTPQMTSGTFHAGLPVPAAPQLTSGTFHAGNPVAQEPIKPLGNLRTIDNPAKRDRVGGP